MTDNDLTDLALNADFRIIFCQSLDDEMVVVENVPDIFKSLRLFIFLFVNKSIFI